MLYYQNLSLKIDLITQYSPSQEITRYRTGSTVCFLDKTLVYYSIVIYNFLNNLNYNNQ